jgi:hypothetical protein
MALDGRLHTFNDRLTHKNGRPQAFNDRRTPADDFPSRMRGKILYVLRRMGRGLRGCSPKLWHPGGICLLKTCPWANRSLRDDGVDVVWVLVGDELLTGNWLCCP